MYNVKALEWLKKQADDYLIGFFGSGGEGESAAGGAAAGTAVALGCLWQVLIYGGMALLGIWLIGAIFG